jgi:putative ABC transport system substrate-binding protein
MRSFNEKADIHRWLGSAAAWPVMAQAQQPAKMPTIGYLGPTTPAVESQRVAAFVQRLRELGWIEGRTIAIEYRWAEGRSERFNEIAAEFVQLKVDVIATYATPPVIAAKQATSAIPIVFGVAADPISASLVASLAHPGGTSPDCRSSRAILAASGSNFCAKLPLASGCWRYWVMSTIPPSCWRCAKLRPRHKSTVLKSLN